MIVIKITFVVALSLLLLSFLLYFSSSFHLSPFRVVPKCSLQCCYCLAFILFMIMILIKIKIKIIIFVIILLFSEWFQNVLYNLVTAGSSLCCSTSLIAGFFQLRISEQLHLSHLGYFKAAIVITKYQYPFRLLRLLEHLQ